MSGDLETIPLKCGFLYKWPDGSLSRPQDVDPGWIQEILLAILKHLVLEGYLDLIGWMDVKTYTPIYENVLQYF